MKNFFKYTINICFNIEFIRCGADTGKNPDNGGDNTKGVNDGTDDGKNDDTMIWRMKALPLRNRFLLIRWN